MNIEQSLKQQGLNLTNEQIKLCEDYLSLLDKWNRVYNLTSIQTLEERVTKHLLDSFSVAPYIKGKRILDVGSGAGLPGIPLAIYYPDYLFTLLDANSKKTAFLAQCRRSLNLTNIDVIHHRIENYQVKDAFDSIICRAFSSLSDFVAQTRHLLADDGILLAMKGQYPQQELAELAQHGVIYQTHRLDVPGLDAQRHMVIITGASSG